MTALRIVPYEPTFEMLQSGCGKHQPGQPMSEGLGECPAFVRRRRIWKDMVKHAPRFDQRPRAKGAGALGRVSYMSHASGYVMVRRPGCIPFVLTEKEWLALPLWEQGR